MPALYQLSYPAQYGWFLYFNKFVKFFAIEVAINNEIKNTFVAKICQKGFRPEVFCQIQIFGWKITSFSKTMLLQREMFFTMCYTTNSSQLHVLLTTIFNNPQFSVRWNVYRTWMRYINEHNTDCWMLIETNISFSHFRNFQSLPKSQPIRYSFFTKELKNSRTNKFK